MQTINLSSVHNLRQIPKTDSCYDPFLHYLIYISSSLFLESSLDNEIQTTSDETVEATCNEEEMRLATAQPMIC